MFSARRAGAAGMMLACVIAGCDMGCDSLSIIEIEV